MICRHCGAPIRYRRLSKGWHHASPLGLLRVSYNEYRDVISDPPRRGQELHRPSVLHPAEPEGRR